MDTLEILKAGRELISDPARWTTDKYARDASGMAANYLWPEAVCFCSLGAVYRAAGGIGKGVFAATVLESFADGDVPNFNDNHTHAEVLAMWDRAIAAESAKVAP